MLEEKPTMNTELLEQIKTLNDLRNSNDDRLRAGIEEIEAILRELKFGLPLRTLVPHEGHLLYKKEGNKWRLFFDNSQFNHSETTVPLVNCSRGLRIKALAHLPALIESAIDILHQILLDQHQAEQNLLAATNILRAFSLSTIPQKTPES